MNKPVKKANQISRAVIKTVAGMSISKPEELLQIAAHAGNKILKKEFSKALHDTYAYFINKGEIDSKYFDTTNFADLAPEFGKVYDSDFSLDKLNQLRKIFINLAKDNGSNSHKKYLLDIALQMVEPEIKVLVADFEIATKELWKPANAIASVAEWQREIAKVSGLQHEALVGLYSEKLEAKMLISGRQYSDKSGIAWQNGKSRLTDMGMELCKLMFLDDDPIT